MKTWGDTFAALVQTGLAVASLVHFTASWIKGGAGWGSSVLDMALFVALCASLATKLERGQA